jgi:6-phosphogluconolactonase
VKPPAVRILPDAPAVTAELAAAFVDAAREAVAQRGVFNVALSGGTTPKAAYELLAAEPLRSQVDWPNVSIYFGDERCVPPRDAASNYRMAHDALLGKVPIPEENVFRMRGEADPGIAANEYATDMRAELGNRPHFDLVLLGLGDNAHTASLFPGTLPDFDDDALVRAVYVAPLDMWRLTITPLVINEARSVVFAVAGEAKAPALAAVLEGPHDPARWPAQIVHPSPGNLVWLADAAAARNLHEATR